LGEETRRKKWNSVLFGQTSHRKERCRTSRVYRKKKTMGKGGRRDSGWLAKKRFLELRGAERGSQ